MSFQNPTIATTVGRSTLTANTKRVVQIAKRMPTLHENVARLSSLAMKVSKKPVGDTAFGHNEQEPLPYIFTFNGATESSAGTTLTVANFTNGSAIIEDDLLFVPRPDSLEVISVASAPSTTFTAIRNVGGTTAVLKQGDTLIRIGNAREEGVTSARAAKTTVEEFKQFYLQNYNWTKKFTEVAIAAEVFNDPTRVNEHKKMMIEMKIDLELGLYFGQSSADIGGTTFAQPASLGLHQHITNGGNISSATILTFDEIEALLETPYNYGATEGFLCACSPFFARQVNAMARGQLQTSRDEKIYGNRIKSLETTYGDVDIMPLPLLRGSHLKSIAWFIPKPFGEYIFHRYLAGNGQNHDFKIIENTQADDSQLVQDEARTWCGYEFYENYKFAMFNRVIG